MSMYAIIMAGGAGTRFWPLSRRSRPKQLVPFVGEAPMLAETLLRLQPLVPLERTVVVTSAALVEATARLAPGLPRENILAEPVGRNTAPCIGLATRWIQARAPGDDPVIGVFAADHHVADPATFLQDVAQAAAVAAEEPGAIVTLGVTPDRPETGYGYIQRGAARGASWEVARFVEKPDRATAEGYLASGDFLWNAGLFFFRASALQAELTRQLPALAAGLDALASHLGTPGWDEALASGFPALPSVSIDYGVMEGARQVRVVPTACGWSDLGHWGAMGDVLPRDAAGNVAQGQVVSLECAGSILINRAPGHLIAALGVEGLVVVVTPDATLVLPAERSQEVRALVDALATAAPEALE